MWKSHEILCQAHSSAKTHFQSSHIDGQVALHNEVIVISNITSAHKTLWAESRHSHLSCEKSTATSLKVKRPWNKKVRLTMCYLEVLFWIYGNRMWTNQDNYWNRWCPIQSHSIMNVLTLWRQDEIVFQAVYMKQKIYLRSGNHYPSITDVIMLHRITVDMSQKENSWGGNVLQLLYQ